jgi:hypothetical protein
VRDEFENGKEEWLEQLKEITGENWKIEINPNAVYPYAEEDYPKTRLGSCLKGYLEGAVYKLKYFLEQYGEDGKRELNEVAFAHTIGLEADERDKKKVCNYTAVVIKDGVLTLLFNPKKLGTNTGDSLDYLLDALNEASQVPADKADASTVLSSGTRLGISKDYTPHIEEVEEKIREITGNEKFILDPNFEEVYTAIRPVASKERDDWERRMGATTLEYLKGAIYKMEYLKIGTDDMLQEGFNEAVDKGKIVLRVVPKFTTKQSNYNECVIEDGVLYIQVRISDCWIDRANNFLRLFQRSGVTTLATLSRPL